ncbi:CDP-diacylglycerol--serine O-phosphatidyltransferase [Gorillibacterium massiliense]|uniref:CDP-diacylglycerol--serine O-phosphatidyltransferase n=1 Tax=Gorillibacterium massiliense TaxID=1280390 RepID=UPI0004BC10E7|nr:CDP-diacylglycerol--serine O-phosphatidyltransferase [Gorillibacterium massiliense]
MIKQWIPNLMTFSNLSFGVIAILEIVKEEYMMSAICILLSVFIDRYDGKVARRLNVSNAIGKELDSLADVVAFGVAPAILIFCKFNFMEYRILKIVGVGVLILYIISGSYRLARYNIQTFNGVFSGIPITVSGFILAIYSLSVPGNREYAYVALLTIAILSYFMVSKFKLKKI